MNIPEGVTWDVAKTKEYYKTKNEMCQCSHCRNFYRTVEKFYPALKEYLSQFGLSLEQPVEATHFYQDEGGLLHYWVVYAVVRKSKRKNQFCIFGKFANLI